MENKCFWRGVSGRVTGMVAVFYFSPWQRPKCTTPWSKCNTSAQNVHHPYGCFSCVAIYTIDGDRLWKLIFVQWQASRCRYAGAKNNMPFASTEDKGAKVRMLGEQHTWFRAPHVLAGVQRFGSQQRGIVQFLAIEVRNPPHNLNASWSRGWRTTSLKHPRIHHSNNNLVIPKGNTALCRIRMQHPSYTCEACYVCVHSCCGGGGLSVHCAQRGHWKIGVLEASGPHQPFRPV